MLPPARRQIAAHYACRWKPSGRGRIDNHAQEGEDRERAGCFRGGAGQRKRQQPDPVPAGRAGQQPERLTDLDDCAASGMHGAGYIIRLPNGHIRAFG